MSEVAGSARSPITRAVLLLVLVGATAACGALSRGPEDGPPRSTFDSDPVTVSVENLSWSTMHVYVAAGGQWESLGQVGSQVTETYEVPSGILGSVKEIRLAADPVGRVEAYFSDPILVEPGDRVEWTLQNNLALSSVMVR